MNDLAAFFDPADFAVRVDFDNGRQIHAIFDLDYSEVVGVDSGTPQLTCRSSDLNGGVRDELLTVEGERYRVVGVMPDGTGVTVLRLARL